MILKDAFMSNNLPEKTAIALFAVKPLINNNKKTSYFLFNECNLMFNPFCRINPQNEAAKKGLERLEKLMKVCPVLVLHFLFWRHIDSLIVDMQRLKK